MSHHAVTSTTAIDALGTRLTLRALAGSALGVLPLLQLLSDFSWLVQAWIAMAIVIVPAAVLRLRRAPSALHLLPGIVILIGYLTRVYLPAHAWYGVVPTWSTWTDLRAAGTALGTTVRDSAAPLDSTAPVRLYLSIGLAALALLVDIVTVELRRPAVAGVPLLLVFTLSGAIPRDPVSWLWFALAGAGYLLILSSGSIDDLRTWGRVVTRPERQTRSRLTSALSGRQIGFAAIVAAVLLPFVLPLSSVNVLANALHNGRVGEGGNGRGSTGVSVDPLALLRGQLVRSSPQNLFSVDVAGTGAQNAFYLRTAVLETYTGKSWVPGPAATPQPVTGTLGVAPATSGPTSTTTPFTATITVSNLVNTAPIFATPTALSNIPRTWEWNNRYGLVAGNVSSGLHYTEVVAQPNPSEQALDASPAVRRTGLGVGGPGGAVLSDNLVIDNIPKVVSDLVTTITAGATTPYAKAKALSTYFTDPANGFIYSLQTKDGESGNDLVDFLTTGKAGFCQQYAAALGVMLRVAGIPARVVIGYTHPAPDSSGRFEVTSDDAHAWVEAYFTGIGWLSFDPTPLTGADAARAVTLPWAPHPAAPTITGSSTDSSAAQRAAERDDAAAAANTARASGSTSNTHSHLAWLILAVVSALLLIAAAVPAFLRVRRRRQRIHRARNAGVEPLWDELADTVRDLGLGWSNARSTRQVAAWLGELVLTDEARTSAMSFATSVERFRYAGPSVDQAWRSDADWQQSVSQLTQLRRELIDVCIARVRWRARLLPASLWDHTSAAASRGRSEGTNGRDTSTVSTATR